LRCHTVDGAPHIGPTWAALYGATVPLADGHVVIADEAYLTESMMDPLAKVRRGFPPVMPTYQGLLPAPEAAALVEFVKSLRDVPATPGGQEPAPPPTGPLPPAPVKP
jgi:cytochrome c oxidase subunit 2